MYVMSVITELFELYGLFELGIAVKIPQDRHKRDEEL
ncbi:hypothetical protein SAMN05192588_2129 [Nonlabens sp. Hel1_33_55]|nr:hypothetical protein SAMN05192588_2129 [Nonlabens sp. Hel1_33_55]